MASWLSCAREVLPRAALPVFKSAREAIDEKDALCLCFFEFSHGLEQQPASNLHRNNLALLDVIFNQQRLRGVTLLLAAEEVACRQMCVPKPLHEPRALRALAAAGAPQYAHHPPLLAQRGEEEGYDLSDSRV